MSAEALRIEIPEAYGALFQPSRYKVGKSGRGAAKSWSFARGLLGRTLAAGRPLRILCARELQNSIKDSVHQLFTEQIMTLNLQRAFPYGASFLRGPWGTEFIFKGLRHNYLDIKSLEGIDICWVEEAQRVSNESWQVLIPTIRKAGSEIWVSYNPYLESDPTHQRFAINTPPDTLMMDTSWRDNPFLTAELEAERRYLHKTDPDAYAHVWEGECLQHSDAQILRGKWHVEPFETPIGEHIAGPYLGADFGFSTDPSAMVLCWLDTQERVLYIEHEAGGVGIETDQLPTVFGRVPGAKEHVVRADCARPETISYLRRHGFPQIRGAVKWKESVKEGINWLRALQRIVIHERCTKTAEEARLWSYKVDKITSDVLPDVVDKHNHFWDSVRYALEPIIRVRKWGVVK